MGDEPEREGAEMGHLLVNDHQHEEPGEAEHRRDGKSSYEGVESWNWRQNAKRRSTGF